MKRAGLKVRLALAWLWFRRKVLRRAPAVVQAPIPKDYHHRYVGPTNVWGLRSGAPCKVLRPWAGGVKIETAGGMVWTVAKYEVERV